MTKYKKIAFIFPGQGAQYVGMGKDFRENFSAARLTYEEADEILKRNLSEVIFNGPEDALTLTKNSQTGIYVTSIAILRVIQEVVEFIPSVCAGLSLGEYTALTASETLSFISCLPLIQHRADFMNQACQAHPGTMAVILGLSSEQVERIVKEVNLPDDLWIANYNCPGQIVISGTIKGIEAGSKAATANGAKRVLPLNVQGAFHSGLMKQAAEKLKSYVQDASFKNGTCDLVMNVPGDFVKDLSQLKQNLIDQVYHSVRWEQGIKAMDRSGIDLFIEIGPGKTLTGLNKKIAPKGETINIESVQDLDTLTKALRG